MARRVNISSPDPTVNGQLDNPGDAMESEATAESLEFDPAKLVEAESRESTTARDPYDPEFIGLSQRLRNGSSRQKTVGRYPRQEKPSKARVFRVHPDPKFRLKTVLLSLKEANETYLISPSLRQALAGEGTCGIFTLLACITKQGTPFLWPIRMADADGKWNIWHESGWQIAEKAMVRWARMQANQDAGHYVAAYDHRPLAEQQEPAWPELAHVC